MIQFPCSHELLYPAAGPLFLYPVRPAATFYLHHIYFYQAIGIFHQNKIKYSLHF